MKPDQVLDAIQPVIDELVALQRKVATLEGTQEFADRVSDTLKRAEAVLERDVKNAVFLITGFAALPDTTRCTHAGTSIIFGDRA